MTTKEQIKKYTKITNKWVNDFLIIGTFSENGPKKCSGLDITQYSEVEIEKQFSDGFKKLKCITIDHLTPFETKQNFIFCAFEKIK